MSDTQLNSTESAEKTFTQEDVNRIVSERLAKERSKGESGVTADELSKRAAELDARESHLNAVEALRKAGISEEFADIIKGESLDKGIELLSKMKGDTDREPAVIGTGNPIGSFGHSGANEGNALKKAFGL